VHNTGVVLWVAPRKLIWSELTDVFWVGFTHFKSPGCCCCCWIFTTTDSSNTRFEFLFKSWVCCTWLMRSLTCLWHCPLLYRAQCTAVYSDGVLQWYHVGAFLSSKSAPADSVGVTRGDNPQKHGNPQIIHFSSAKKDIWHWNSIEQTYEVVSKVCKRGEWSKQQSDHWWFPDHYPCSHSIHEGSYHD